MNQIENIFVCEDDNKFDVQDNHSSASNLNRIKMGEVYKIQNEKYSLVCVQCSDEFQYFTEFTLHVEEHLRKLASENFHRTEDNKTVEIKVEIDTEIGETQMITESPKTRNGSINNTTVVDVAAKVEIQSSEDDGDPAFENDTFIDDYSDDEILGNKSKEIKIENSFNKKETIKQKPTPKEVVKKPPKTKIVRRKAKPKKMDSYMKQLLAEEEQKSNDEMLLAIFNKYKAELACTLFPMDLIDTPESRLLSKFAVRRYRFERGGDGGEFPVCPICKTTFKDVNTIRRHIFSHASGPFFQCGLCAETFRMPRYLRVHLRDGHKQDSNSYECFICHKPFIFHGTLKQHMNTHVSENLDCTICNRRFVKFRFYQNHMNAIHPNGVKFESQLPVKEELYDYPAERPLITSFECYLCQKNFRERRQLRNHLRLHSQQPKLCLICGRQVSSTTSMNRHMQLHKETEEAKSHKCTICFKEFRVRTYLLRHNRKEHNLYADNTPPLCKICGAQFENRRLLHIHMRTHPFQETRNFICSICNHAARNAYNLRRHMETHNTDRSFKCDICHKTFAPHYARQHMQSHSNVKKHKCTVSGCGKRFKRPYGLKQHMFSHGTGPKHSCDVCQQSFSRTDKLLRHRRLHGVPLNFHCTICGKGFISQKSYLRHESSHTK